MYMICTLYLWASLLGHEPPTSLRAINVCSSFLAFHECPNKLFKKHYLICSL
uniref:Uncharacterized protein n=1 Tax=Arundo donax TaxID=35708 RepID=A0A0A9AVY0_ARUDO